MTRSGQITSILIVGGGTAGWMTAAYLSRFLHRADCAITLIESPDIESIGVGEATIPALVNFVRNMGLDEREFMRRCSATYKLGIKFVDWIQPGDAHWHPFGLCGGIIDDVDLFHFWLKSLDAGYQEGPYSAYSLQALLGELGKGPCGVDGETIVTRQGGYAYHLDAQALGDYLREVALATGVKHLLGDVKQVVVDANGFIDYVATGGGRSLAADLYIDCTGFQSLLIEQALGDPWIDWSDQLLCDRAVVLPLPPDEEMHPFTHSTALSAGWAWRIPLSQRVGCGYVYSSDHIGQDAAALELLAHAGLDGFRGTEPRQLKMRVGRRQNFWKTNCVSIGLASGFIEPLESTGIFFIQSALEVLFEHFPDSTFGKPLIAAYNKKMGVAYDNVRDFILLHYLLSQRKEAFWVDSRHVAVPNALQEALELYDECGIVDTLASVFPSTSLYHILAGGQRLPRRWSPLADKSDFAQVRKFFGEIKAKNQSLADSLPAHRTLMDDLHQPDN